MVHGRAIRIGSFPAITNDCRALRRCPQSRRCFYFIWTKNVSFLSFDRCLHCCRDRQSWPRCHLIAAPRVETYHPKCNLTCAIMLSMVFFLSKILEKKNIYLEYYGEIRFTVFKPQRLLTFLPFETLFLLPNTSY